MAKKIVGTGKFTYKEHCSSCGRIKMVDINGECRECYNSMKAFRRGLIK
jgi:hypothetical protein